jgi:hypothetical protein
MLPLLHCLRLQMLRRYWAAFPAERSQAPEATAERILVFQRGAEVVSIAALRCPVLRCSALLRCARRLPGSTHPTSCPQLRPPTCLCARRPP